MSASSLKFQVRGHSRSFNRVIKRYYWNYILLLPAVILLIMFSYVPMYGLMIAFKTYKIKAGIVGILTSPWAGTGNFWFLQDPYFWQTVRNTLLITIYRLVICFPIPILLSIMLNEVRNRAYKRLVQSISYLPYFISWIVVAYMINQLLAVDSGAVNNILSTMGFERIYFMGEERYFRHIVVFSALWKSMGWGTIIYLAALSNVDPQLQEAAFIDGAGRFRRIWHIDMPAITPTIVIMLILAVPGILSAGYDQILPLQNPANMGVSDVMDIYVIRLGMLQAQYSLSTAMGLMSSIVNLALVLLTNYVCRALGQEGLF